jgi:diguanylate cyclase (GGDEF)-like protein
VLKKIANVLTRQTKRAGDFVARYGGEEFVVILPNTALENAQRVAEAIRCEVEALMIPNIKIPLQRVTVSLGVASTIPGYMLTVTEFVAQADQQLYLAKQQGRNQVQPSMVAVMTSCESGFG